MKQDKFIYYPLFASRSLNGGIQDDIENKQVRDALTRLSSEQRLRLMSDNMTEAICALDEQFHIPDQFVEYVTVLVRDMFFGQLSEQEVLRALRSELAKIPNIQLDAVIQHIQLHIFNVKADPDEVDEEPEKDQGVNITQENVKQHTLLDALGKFSNLGSQLITSENIKLKSQVALVRPTLTNWLKNYRDELGIGKHDAVARARFLFESQNTEKLTSSERDRIHALVRSLEDNELLSIDPQKQEIAFLDERKKNTESEKKVFHEEVAPDIFERFQNAPVREELQNVGTQTFRAAEPTVKRESTEEEGVLGRIKNMNVTPVAANAPAPKEDFILPEEQPVTVSQNEPLGTLRFSAKHVLPAERQQRNIVEKKTPPMDPRIQHFRPQEVPIPNGQKSYTYNPDTRIQHSVKREVPEEPKHQMVAPVTTLPAKNNVAIDQERKKAPEVVNTPSSSQVSQQSVFRIKPSRE